MSFESSGLPLAVWLPAMTQLFEPERSRGRWAGRGAREVRWCSRGAGGRWRRQSAHLGVFVIVVIVSCWCEATGCGCAQSSLTPVGGRSRHEPTG